MPEHTVKYSFALYGSIYGSGSYDSSCRNQPLILCYSLADIDLTALNLTTVNSGVSV